MKHLVKLLLVDLIVSVALAQAPQGTYRLRYSNMGNGEHMFRKGLILSQDFAQVGSNQTVPNLFGNVANAVLGNDTGTTDNDPITYNGWIGFPDSGAFIATAYNAADNFSTGQMYIHFVAQPSVQGANITPLSKWAGGGFNRSILFYFGQDQANSSPSCFVLQTDGSVVGAVPSVTNTVNVWDAWACVADGSLITVYKNGKPVNGASSYNGTINWANQPLYTGSFDGGVTYAYRGYIAHMQLGNIAPTPNQVWRDYKILRRRMLAMYGINLP